MSAKAKVDWLRCRFGKVVIKLLREVERLGRNNPAIWDLNSGAFPAFVYEFMHPQYRQHVTGSKKTYGHALYEQFRCGLSHGLTIEGREITTRPSRYIHDNSGHVSIDLWSLFEEMRRALDRYVTKVHTDKGSQQRFLRRFDKLFIQPYPKKTLKSGVVGTRITVSARGSQ